jgi:hypothetical protein
VGEGMRPVVAGEAAGAGEGLRLGTAGEAAGAGEGLEARRRMLLIVVIKRSGPRPSDTLLLLKIPIL